MLALQAGTQNPMASTASVTLCACASLAGACAESPGWGGPSGTREVLCPRSSSSCPAWLWDCKLWQP